MTALLERPDEDRAVRARPGQAPRRRAANGPATLRVTALVVAATLPFGRVFITDQWLVPLLTAALLPVGLSYLARVLRLRWWGALGLQAVAWLWCVAVVLLPGTLWAGVVPTPETAQFGVRVAVIAAERVAVLPAPVYPEVPLLLLAVTGVWWVATSIDVLAIRLDAPGKALICATTMWTVPLAIVPAGDPPWLLAGPLVLAGAAVMLAQAGRDFARWGPVVAPGARPSDATAPPRQPVGVVLAVSALVVGVIVAGLLPGFGDPPWYELRATSTTTLTDNPIVQLRTNLVASDTGAVLRVRSAEPVYLRSTALDVYSDAEAWVTSGIEPQPLDDGIVPGGSFSSRSHEVRVEVVDVSDGVLVPAPPHPMRFDGPRGVTPRYDPRTATFTFGTDRLVSGQRYSVVASRPRWDPDIVAALDTPAPPRLTALPEQVPPEVGRLARRIVEDAGATTPFTQALAIQNELRTWEYSLRPPAGHSGLAMRTFLEQRVGYCEQFAGTMAVMLRTLGIPARVAVGFTPGTVDPDDPTLWTVSWSNAHAWVEVKFGGQWLAFEPTPRSDGNVLVPTVSDLEPSQTQLAPDATAPVGPQAPTADDFSVFDEREALLNRQNSLDQGVAGGVASGATQVSRRLVDPWTVAGVAAMLIIALIALVQLGRRSVAPTTPTDRVFATRDRIGRLGHGLGLPAPPWETDREYLARLGRGSPHGADLAAAVTSARFAPSVSAETAETAEHAGAALSAELLDGHTTWRRMLIRARGDAAAGWQRVRRALRRAR